MGAGNILAIDQGTTLTRAMVFDAKGKPVASAGEPLPQIYPRAGWVEHDPETIWSLTLKVSREALAKVGNAEVAAIGITNQRETTLVWDRATAEPLANAIVWQDRRTSDMCEKLRAEGLGSHVAEATGLVIDPYFSATKLAWLLEKTPQLRARAEAGEACFGTVDTWLIFKLTGGKVHATDATNASRTLLYDIRSGQWDAKLLDRFAVPRAMLPKVLDCQADYGMSEAAHFGRALPIRGVAGDQQAATFGQTCFAPGTAKATYGTGCFLLVNTGDKKIKSTAGMLATIAYQLEGKRTYGLEGAIFMAGATMQWLRDSLGLLTDLGESGEMARKADAKSGVYLVPAFQGLGAPYWDADARGAIVGLSRAAGRNEVVRAGLESVAFQTCDILRAIEQDMKQAGLPALSVLRADGGMTANPWFMQFLADMVGMPVEVPEVADTTALGAGFHAGLAAGVYASQAELQKLWKAAARYEPRLSADERESKYAGWVRAVERVKSRPD